MSVLEFALVGSTLVSFTLTNGAEVPENYVLLLVLIKLSKNTTFFTTLLSLYIYIFQYELRALCHVDQKKIYEGCFQRITDYVLYMFSGKIHQHKAEPGLAHYAER